MLQDLNYWAVLVSAVVFFMLGAAWYTVFGKQWLALVGKTEEEIRKNSSAMPYIIAGITALVTAAVLALVLRQTGHDTTLARGLRMSFLLWLGFAIGTAAKHYAFPGKPARLLLIDYGYDLVGLLIMGSIIALWPK